MKFLTAALLLISVSFAQAKDETMKMYYNNVSIVKIIEDYSKATGQKFVVDSNLKGTSSIFIQDPVSHEEAFNQLSTALALNGYAISKRDDTMVVAAARNIQRDLIEVGTERPALKPERMYTWVYNVKNTTADTINRDLRIMTSKDGEFSVYVPNNQIIFSDWTSNLNRVADLLKQIDVKPTTVKK